MVVHYIRVVSHFCGRSFSSDGRLRGWRLEVDSPRKPLVSI